MTNDLQATKQLICDIGRKIWQRGYCAGNEGNHSIRIDDNHILCTPTGVSKGDLTPQMICLTDMTGSNIDTSAQYKPSSEIKVHIAIYNHRPDVKAVVHSHPPHPTAFAIAGIPLPEGIHPEAEVFLGRVPLAPYATPSTPDLPKSIIPLIKPDTTTVIMANHGSVTFDKDLTNAYYKLEILDAYCRALLLAKQLGNINTLTEQQMNDLLKVKKSFGFNDSRYPFSSNNPLGPQNKVFLNSSDT